MYLVLFAALTAVYAEPYGYKAYLPPTPGPLFRNSAFGGYVQGVPAGGYTNDFQGVVVDADPPGSSRLAPGIESGLGRPRESYGSTNSKVGEAGFKTTFGAFNDRNVGPGTRIAPGFESIVSGSEGANDFKIGDAAYKIAPGFLTNEFLKTSAEESDTRRKEQDAVNCAHGSYDAQKYNKGNSENLPHNENHHFGSIHGSIGTINHSTQFNNKFGKPVSNQVYENHQIVNNAGTDQVNNVYSPIAISEINKESSLTSYGQIPGSTPPVISVIKATINKESLGYQYKVPHVIFDPQKFDGYSHFRETNIQGIQNGKITSKLVDKGESTVNQGLLNIQKVQTHSVQSTTKSKPNTNVNVNNVVTQTTSQLQTDKTRQMIKPTDISSTGLATPFTSYANIQSSEGVLGINAKDSTTKSQPETATGTLSIVPTKPFSTFTKYHSSSQTQTQLSSFNFERPNKYSHTFEINKPINTLPSHFSASKTSFAGSASSSYNPNKFTSHFDNTQLNGQAISSAKPVESALTVLNTNMKNSGEVSSLQISTQTNLPETSIDISKHVSSKESSSQFLETSSEVSAPALSLNYLIQEGNQEHKESSAVDINSNIQTATAFVSTGFTKPQNIDGKHTSSSAKHTQIQGSDHSYYYDKPQKPLVIPTKSNYGTLDIAQTGTQISTTKSENVQSQTNSKESEQNIQNRNNFGHISQIQSTQTGISLENTQTQTEQTQSAKPSVTHNIKETGIFQTKFGGPMIKPHYDQTAQTISSQSGNIISENINQSQLQDTKVGITQTDINNLQTSTTSSSMSNSQSAVQANLHTIKPFADSAVQQSGTSQTNVGIQSTSPEFIQSQILFPAPKQTITQQTTSEITQNKFGVTQFGAQVKPSVQSQQSLGESYEYKKPDVKLTFDKNTGTSTTSSIQEIKPEVSQTSFETQTFTATQFGVTPPKPQVSQSQFAFQPAKNTFQQTIFDNTQNKYGLTNFGTQNFKPSSVGQSQQSTGQLYEYKKPEIVITNKNTNTATGQVSESQPKITQIRQTSLPTPQPVPIPSVQLQTEAEITQTLNAQNVATSDFQTSTQFEKPQSVQVNSGTETLKPEFNQTPQKSTQTSTSTETIHTQIAPQPVKINFEQSTFGITQNKYGLTQFGTQKFKPSTSQLQPYTGQLYEYKKPVESFTNNKDTVNQFQSQFTEVVQTPSLIPHVSQVKPEQLSITSQTGTTSTQTSITQRVPFTFQTSSQFGKNQFGQTNFGTQSFKPPFGQTSQTNTATTGSQFGVAAVKPQVVSQLDKVTFGQSTFDSTRNKYGLTQFGAQKFKPSITPSTQISTGELYEYRKPVQTLTPSKETNMLTEQVTQTQSQVSQTSSSTPQVVQVNPAQSMITSQTGATPTHTLSSQKESASTLQTSSQFGKPQCVQNNFGTQTFKPGCIQTSQSSTATTNTQTSQIQVASQLPKITFGSSALASAQNKYGLTQFGTQKFKPSQSQESTGQQYEYKKPAEIVITNKDTDTEQISKSQSVQQAEVIPNQTLNIQKESASTSQTSITSTNTQKMQGTQIGQVSDTQVVSQPVAAILEQSTLIKDTQNKFGLEQSDAEKPKPSIGKLQETQGTLYTNRKPFETIEINKETQSDLIINKFNKQEILHTASGTSQTTSGINKQDSGNLYVDNNPSIAFVTNAGSSIQEVNKVNQIQNTGGEKTSTETQKVIPTQVISEPQTVRIVTNQPIKAESSVYQTKPSQQILQTTSEKAEITRTEEEVGLEIKKPINIQETQSTVEQSQLTNNVNKYILSVKPEIGNSTLETQVNETEVGLTENKFTFDKPTMNIVIENKSSVINNIQNTQTLQSGIQDSKVNQVQTTSQTQSANTLTNPSALGILSTKPYVNQNQIGMQQDISSLEQISQVTSGAVETSSSQAQSVTPVSCETSKGEDINNKQSISTGTITNQQAISYNTQDGQSPPGFGFHNHGFESQSGYRHNKPFGYFDNGYTEKNQFEQNRSPFGKFRFFNEPNNFPKTFETTSSNAVTTGSVTQTNNLPSQAQNKVILTQNPTIDQIKEQFDSTFSSNAHTIIEPMKPTIITTGSNAEDGASISTVTGAEPHVPFGKPALHKFGGLLNSNADATVQTAPSLSIAQASTRPSSTRLKGIPKQDNPSNAIATAQSRNAFGQTNFASAIATTGPVLPQFNTPGGRFQPFTTFDGYPASAVAKAVFGPQVGVNPTQATTGVPFSSNAFASTTKDSSFASGFVSTTPATSTIFGAKKGTANFGSELSTPVFGEVNTAKPIYDGKSYIFGYPRDPSKFDEITGYQY
ncbi:hypothetical protein K1T71_010472 [Dendrolimus kikuchii]|uniref:Uncharacterized protein n=1 Tax=Dendrolimus kikuchii TaxID=765133 RepID=A0ACC1CRV0_9NEOP|nr:hypothetical protein K1T71_010472 [Dendrolimus kikuchii]